MEELTNLSDGYFLLAVAIVKQAADDYRIAYRRFLRTGVRNSTVIEIERWMLRGFGSILSLNRGRDILSRIQREEELRIKPIKRRAGKKITLNGKSLTLREWCEELGISISTIKTRLYRGMTVEEALTIPIGKARRKHQDEK